MARNIRRYGPLFPFTPAARQCLRHQCFPCLLLGFSLPTPFGSKFDFSFLLRRVAPFQDAAAKRGEKCFLICVLLLLLLLRRAFADCISPFSRANVPFSERRRRRRTVEAAIQFLPRDAKRKDKMEEGEEEEEEEERRRFLPFPFFAAGSLTLSRRRPG